jgi:predicted Zn finger-like uncharacterized protein
MINTKCPECSARFYVSEELVAKKVVRFRCRKCGGTITVDGSRSDDGAEKASPTEGADDMLLSRYPPAPGAAGKGEKPGTLRPPGMLAPAVDDGRPATLPDQPETKASVAVRGNGKAKPSEAKAGASKVVEIKQPAPRASEPKIKQDKPKDVKKPADKVADADGEPTTEWTKSSAFDRKDAPPSSKPRLSRVSMDLGSVFEMPKDEEDVEIPMDVEHAPAFEEEIEPEPLSVMPSSVEPVSLDPDTLAPDPVAKRTPPPVPVGAGPRIKPPPPKPRNLDRASSARVDISAAMSRMDERISDPPNEFFAPVVMPPVNILEEPAPPSEKPAKVQPALAPALAVPEPIVRPSAEPAQPSSGRGLYIGIGVVGLALVLGVGYFAMRGDETGTGPVAAGPDPAAIENPSEPTRTAVEPTAAVTAPADPTADPTAAPTVQPEPSTVATATATAKPSTEPTSEPTRDTTSSLVASPGTTTAAPPATTAPTSTATAPTATAAATTPATTATTPAPPPPGEGGGAPFDKAAASASIGALKGAAQGCKQPDGPQGNASVSITFAPSGRVTVAMVNGPPFAGTPVGGCIAATFRRASVPPFSGSNVTVRTTVPIF